MNFGNQLLDQGFQVLADVHAEKTATGKPGLVLVRTGKAFKGVLEMAPPISPGEVAMLGYDPREFTVLNVLREDDPGVKISDTIAFVEDSSVVWKVRHREDNPADSVTKYWCSHVVPGVDL